MCLCAWSRLAAMTLGGGGHNAATQVFARDPAESLLYYEKARTNTLAQPRAKTPFAAPRAKTRLLKRVPQHACSTACRNTLRNNSDLPQCIAPKARSHGETQGRRRENRNTKSTFKKSKRAASEKASTVLRTRNRPCFGQGTSPASDQEQALLRTRQEPCFGQ